MKKGNRPIGNRTHGSLRQPSGNILMHTGNREGEDRANAPATSILERTRRGQTWSLDFLAAGIAITFIVILVVLTMNSIIFRWADIENYNSMYGTAIFASESIVTTPGLPENWEMLPNGSESRIVSFGLVNERNVINPRKLERMQTIANANYTMLKVKLGSTRNNVYVNITSSDRKTLHGQFGVAPQNNQSVFFERLAIINESAVIVRVVIWR